MNAPKTKTIYTYGNGSGRPSKREVISDAAAPEQSLFTVGTNGDFSTLNAAFAYLDTFPSYINRIELRMLDGYYIEEKLEFVGKDYRNIVLTSEGAENVISREFFLQNETDEAFITAEQTFLPLFAARLRMDESGTAFSGNNNLGNQNNIFNITSSTLKFASSNHPLLGGLPAGISGAMGYNVFSITSDFLMDFESYSRNSGNRHGEDFTFTGGALSAWTTNVSTSFNSRLTLSGVEISTSPHTTIRVGSGSIAYIQQSSVFGAGTNSIRVERGASVNIFFSDIRMDDATEVASDIDISKAGFVRMADSLGGSNLTPNTITSDGLLIR